MCTMHPSFMSAFTFDLIMHPICFYFCFNHLVALHDEDGALKVDCTKLIMCCYYVVLLLSDLSRSYLLVNILACNLMLSCRFLSSSILIFPLILCLQEGPLPHNDSLSYRPLDIYPAPLHRS